jgi:four helix bundle protein
VLQKVQRSPCLFAFLPTFSTGIGRARARDMAGPPYGSYGENIRDRAFEFACNVVGYCDELFRREGVGRVLAPQLLRCATSIGANLAEARAGESRADFISKCSIALKEARETEFRLRVAVRCQIGSLKTAAALANEAGELSAILGAIVRNTRRVV